jgi:hypothetical protein
MASVDKTQILDELNINFEYSGVASVDDNGLVSVTGNVSMWRGPKQLPVSFYRIDGDLNLFNRGLVTLKGCPQIVGESFDCHGNELENLKYAPKYVGSNCWVDSNRLTNLEGAPEYVGYGFYCEQDSLRSLKGMPRHIGDELGFGYKKNLGLCGALLYDCTVIIDNVPTEVDNLIKKYRNSGYSGMIPFAASLIQAGYSENAWLW